MTVIQWFNLIQNSFGTISPRISCKLHHSQLVANIPLVLATLNFTDRIFPPLPKFLPSLQELREPYNTRGWNIRHLMYIGWVP